MRASTIAGAAAIALLVAPVAAKSQEVRAGKIPAVAHETLDASMARLAVKAALQPRAQPTREELLRVIVLMSLRQQRSGT